MGWGGEVGGRRVGILSRCGHVQTVCGLGRQSQGHRAGNVVVVGGGGAGLPPE